MTSIGKRPLYSITEPHHLHHQWSVCKRPRHVTTPTSAISVITAEDDDHISTHSSPVYNYHLSSPTYTLNFSAPPTPQFHFEQQHQQQHQQQYQQQYQQHQQHQQQSHLQSSSYTPPSQVFDHYALRSHDQIAVDVHNSFTTPHTPNIAWNNEMLIHLLTNDIEDLCFINNRNGACGVSDQYHSFFSQYKQPFELEFYIRRLVQYSNCSTAAFIIMLIYLDRIQRNCKQLLVTDMNCHRLLSTALVLAIKYLDDEVFSNSYYARVGGVTPDEMNQLELKLLHVLDWNLSVSPETFGLYEEGLMESANLLTQQHIPCSPTSAA